MLDSRIIPNDDETTRNQPNDIHDVQANDIHGVQGDIKLICEEDIDIYEYPEERREAVEGEIISIGDLHGNTIKLLYFLLREGIIEMLGDTLDQRKQNYKVLVAEYQNLFSLDDVEQIKQSLKQFNNMVSKIIIKTKETKIRLIGDEVSDRGCNDYLTFKVFERLDTNSVPLEILYSNHGAAFLDTCERPVADEPYKPISFVQKDQARSMINLNYLVKKKIIQEEDVQELIDKHYKPHIKALSYELSDDKQCILIHSHAPIGLSTIKKMAKRLGIESNVDTATEIADTIDAINIKFNEYVTKGESHYLFCYLSKQDEADKLQQTDDQLFFNREPNSDNPFLCLIWNRNYKNIEDRANKYFFAFGHVGPSPINQSNLINLDNNELGKYTYDRKLNGYNHNNKGSYLVMHSKAGFSHKLGCKRINIKKPSPSIQLEPIQDHHSIATPKDKKGVKNFFKRHWKIMLIGGLLAATALGIVFGFGVGGVVLGFITAKVAAGLGAAGFAVAPKTATIIGASALTVTTIGTGAAIGGAVGKVMESHEPKEDQVPPLKATDQTNNSVIYKTVGRIQSTTESNDNSKIAMPNETISNNQAPTTTTSNNKKLSTQANSQNQQDSDQYFSNKPTLS